MKPLRFGIIGLSEGNGHPYSWSAIFNGYDREKMASCPFPVIPDYLSRQVFPRDRLAGGRVTHIWTQNEGVSRRVAEAALIENVVDNYEDMIGEVDGVLLARDDAENHYDMSVPFIRAGLPIYIDKPLALSTDEARRILDLQVKDHQVFTCSALAFAPELRLSKSERSSLGMLRRVEARIANSWSKYAVHIIEPVLNLIGDRGGVSTCERTVAGERCSLQVTWESGLRTLFTTTGSQPTAPEIVLIGDGGEKTLRFADAFGAFKATLKQFVAVARGEQESIPREFVIEVVKLVEIGVGIG